MKIQDVEDRTHRCVGCSQCFGTGPHLPFADGNQTVTTWICPTLEYYDFFTNTARGKSLFARDYVHGKLDLDEEIARIFYSCPDCGCCEVMCPPIPHMFISRAMKADLNRAGFLPEECRKLNENMRRDYNLFGITNSNRAKWAKGLDLPKEGDVLYFAGCYASFRQVKTAWATVELLRAGGMQPAYLAEEEWCCGLHAGFSGDIELERELAKHNVEAIKKAGAKTVVFSCANGYRTFYSDYPDLLGEKLPFEIRHGVEIVLDIIKDGAVSFSKGEPKRVTLHDPCHFGKQHIGRHHDLYEETRNIIRSLPNVEFAEMEYNRRWSACCGGGNSVTSTWTPEFTEYHSKKRCLEAKQVADVLLTPCVRCVENLSGAAKKHKIDIEVRSLLEFVSERT